MGDVIILKINSTILDVPSLVGVRVSKATCGTEWQKQVYICYISNIQRAPTPYMTVRTLRIEMLMGLVKSQDEPEAALGYAQAICTKQKSDRQSAEEAEESREPRQC